MTSSRSNVSVRPARRPVRRIVGLLLLVLLMVVVVMGVRALRAARAGQAALRELQALQNLDRDALASLDPAYLSEIQGRFTRVELELGIVERQMGPFLPLARHLGWLPRYGAEAQAAPALLQMARAAATAGRASMDGAVMVAAALRAGGDGSALERLTPALVQSQPSWQQAQAALDTVAAARQTVDLSRLDPRIAGQLARLDEYLPLLQTGAGLAQLAPALLGADAPKTYLLLAQNSDELRPTGGFISGVGLLRIDNGELGPLNFEDSYAIYNSAVDHPLAPPDFAETMGAQILLFRDANWSADFPSTARVTQALYQLDTGLASDGVFAIDLEATRRVIAALEPLTLSGYQEPLTGSNLLAVMRQVWAEPVSTESTIQQAYTSDWWLHRKDFMGDMAAAALLKLQSGQADFGKLAQALYSALQEKHVLIQVNDPAVQAKLAAAGWDGSIAPGSGDFLFVVDTNIGWNKVNGMVQRATHYTLTPEPDGRVRADLELVYRHLGQQTTEPCVHESRYGDSYEEMIRRCYFNYIRVYTPAGVELLASQGFDQPVRAGVGERATTQLSGELTVPPGSERRVTLSYRLPAAALAGDSYHLRVQKQAGASPGPVKIVFVDPAGAWQAIGPAVQRTAQGVQINFDLSRDVELVVCHKETMSCPSVLP